MSQLNLLPNLLFPRFQCSILLVSIKRGSSGEAAALSYLWFPTHLMPLSPAEMCNPRWEQINMQTSICLLEDSVQTRQNFKAHKTFKHQHTLTCLSNKPHGQSLASKPKGNSCLSSCFWKTLLKKNMGAEPGTSETKTRNSTRKVANSQFCCSGPAGGILHEGSQAVK